MSDFEDAMGFLLDASYRGAESKYKNEIKSLKQENEDYKNKISDLEAKLKENEKDIEEFKELAGGLREELIENDCMFKKEIDQLKQQLSEKERKIKGLGLYSKNVIDFAVEQILDIKEEVFGTREIGIIFDIPPVQDAFDAIENKIKQLKEGK